MTDGGEVRGRLPRCAPVSRNAGLNDRVAPIESRPDCRCCGGRRASDLRVQRVFADRGEVGGGRPGHAVTGVTGLNDEVAAIEAGPDCGNGTV